MRFMKCLSSCLQRPTFHIAPSSTGALFCSSSDFGVSSAQVSMIGAHTKAPLRSGDEWCIIPEVYELSVSKSLELLISER
ncbi:hypothetical protein CEXT_500531 [Caerostris extrusa]|uniref:Uncharacterized protein n=1 Tax=Caerostris extrusa TaxID=172846 RepID=A0AAV4UJI4_CAEEX|nr:hypothetical protein CEXT_500531 [Caerostris extrusa]